MGDGACVCLPSMCEVELIPPITSVSASSEKGVYYVICEASVLIMTSALFLA